jgi:hypothetical protein
LIDVVAALKKLNWVIETYPLFRYAADPHDRVTDYMHRLMQVTLEFNPDMIVFICLEITTAELQRYRQQNPHRYFVLYSSHDPHSWFVPELDLKHKAASFDLVLTSCRQSIDWYQQAGTKTTVFTTFGGQPKSRCTQVITCDVSLCIMNLYEHLHDQLISRRHFLDQITQHPHWSGSQPKYKFRLYGPAHFKNLYPDHYGGYVRVSELTRVFQTSQINLSLHTFGTYYGYVNTRSIQILAAGGLLVVDPVPGIADILQPDEECILLDITNPIEQLEKLLTHSDRLTTIARAGHLRVSRNYTWDHWVQQIWREFHRDRFSKTLYQMYNSVDAATATYEHWDHIGRHQGYIGVVPVVPAHFDVTGYAQRYSIKPDNAWFHWLTIGSKSGSIYPYRSMSFLQLTFFDLPFRDKISGIAQLSRCFIHSRTKTQDLENILRLFHQLHRLYPSWNPSMLLQEYFRLDSIS